MDFDFVEHFKDVLASQDDELTALRAALLLMIRLLSDQKAYKTAKARPHSSFRKTAHWLLGGFKPLKAGLNRRQQLALKDGDGQPWLIRRIMDKSDGQYTVVTPQDGDVTALARTLRKYEYDLCISFAGEDRETATAVANKVRRVWSSSKVFLDDFEKWNLWGTDLTFKLYDVYSARSRRCLIIISEAYLRKAWPKHELRAAYARMVQEGVGYILPFIVDASAPPKEMETISYLRLADTTVDELGDRLGELVFREGYSDWLISDEMGDLIDTQFRFNAMMNQFRVAVEEEPVIAEALVKTILGLIWTAEGVTRPVESFFEFLLFDFDALGKRFDSDEQYLAIPPDGYVRRSGNTEGVLLMRGEFWEPLLEEVKGNSPWFSSPADEKASESE